MAWVFPERRTQFSLSIWGMSSTETRITLSPFRCDGTNWVPYIADIDYLAVNDASDPTMWITYNTITCSREKCSFRNWITFPISEIDFTRKLTFSFHLFSAIINENPPQTENQRFRLALYLIFDKYFLSIISEDIDNNNWSRPIVYSSKDDTSLFKCLTRDFLHNISWDLFKKICL